MKFSKGKLNYKFQRTLKFQGSDLQQLSKTIANRFSVTFGYTLAFPKLILHHQLKIDYKRMSNQLRIGRSMLEILIYMKFATDKNAFKMGIIIYYNQILFM